MTTIRRGAGVRLASGDARVNVDTPNMLDNRLRLDDIGAPIVRNVLTKHVAAFT